MQDIYIATLSCDAFCDALITCGMVYTVWRIRTPFRRYVLFKALENAIVLFYTPGLPLKHKKRVEPARDLRYQLRHTEFVSKRLNGGRLLL